SFPTLACGGVLPGKSERSDVRIGDFLSCGAVFGQNANERGSESGTRDAIEEVALKFRAVFLCERDVAAVVKRFFECFAKLLLRCQFGNPAFDAFALAAGSDFELIGIEFARTSFDMRIHVLRNAHARDSSICVFGDSICTSGLKA